MLKPTTKYTPELPSIMLVGRLNPEAQVVEVGYTPQNLIAIAEMFPTKLDQLCVKAKVSRFDLDKALNLEAEIDYFDFVRLCEQTEKTLSKSSPKLRALLPEFGYSPYNLAVIQHDIGVDQAAFATMLNWSTPKLRQHIPANSASAQFKAMSIGNWIYVCDTYEKVLRLSDKKYGIDRDYSAVFFEGKNALNKPTISTLLPKR
ncbi:hypothetical protein [Psychrobacter sp. AOP31-A1-22]|uniref:hypothetical protein n=1 Tax=Psychrobacter sp. AOP31-A1-22 TaxID=3457696 RepID=UPI004035FA50